MSTEFSNRVLALTTESAREYNLAEQVKKHIERVGNSCEACFSPANFHGLWTTSGRTEIFSVCSRHRWGSPYSKANAFHAVSSRFYDGKCVMYPVEIERIMSYDFTPRREMPHEGTPDLAIEVTKYDWKQNKGSNRWPYTLSTRTFNGLQMVYGFVPKKNVVVKDIKDGTFNATKYIVYYDGVRCEGLGAKGFAELTTVLRVSPPPMMQKSHFFAASKEVVAISMNCVERHGLTILTPDENEERVANSELAHQLRVFLSEFTKLVNMVQRSKK